MAQPALTTGGVWGLLGGGGEDEGRPRGKEGRSLPARARRRQSLSLHCTQGARTDAMTSAV